MTPDQLIVPSTPWWRRRWLFVVVATIVVAAFLAAAAAVLLDERRSCGDGVTRFGGTRECVGITDGAFHFELDGPDGEAASMRRVLELIREANDDVRDSGDLWFSVAYVLPMPWRGQGAYPAVNVVHQLYGAYAAQTQANERNDRLKMRLLVANTGHDGVAWEQVAQDLIDRRGSDRLAAVAGLGPSRDTTKEFVAKLSEAGIPMVGATITADDLNGANYPHLYRVSPTNADEVAVGLRYLRGVSESADVNPYLLTVGGQDDTYVATLKEAFRATFPDAFSARTLDPDENGHNQALEALAGDLCASGLPVVAYFAGRAASLRTFLMALGEQCPRNHSVTVLSGDDASALVGTFTPEQTAALQGKAITLVYTGLTHPEQWITKPVELDNLREIVADRMPYAAAGLATGGTIMAYDAVRLAVRALLNVAPSQEDLGQLDSLSNGFAQINTDSPYCGASGPIALEANRPEAAGNTVNKPIPVIEITAAGVAQVRTLLSPTEPENGGVTWDGKCPVQQGMAG
ncbi:ABC transporter substrate-binding protein [Solwaraspora sp. WMMD406]|uniref:ABC transporter substrate-binding protein n=1 Tax=Solwaraspora sp. WMMD406 TaxID=3016095 RepID=UPI002417BF7C|nr:ABC transporter substrate-binding protein [Solwaraspora sp. WMMD406]MDG4765427.1 ABC transporter substrate-binding protein [Solwaraspora sp. WMMD406]